MANDALQAFNNDNTISLHTRGAIPTLLGRSTAGVAAASTLQNVYRRVQYGITLPAGCTEVFPVVRYTEGYCVALYSMGYQAVSSADANGNVSGTATFYIGNNTFGSPLFTGSADTTENMATDVEVFFYGILPPADADFGLHLVSESPTSTSFLGRISGAVAGQPVINFFPYSDAPLTAAQQGVAGIIPQTVGYSRDVYSSPPDNLNFGVTRIGALRMLGGTTYVSQVISHVYRQPIPTQETTPRAYDLPQYYEGNSVFDQNFIYRRRFVDLSLPISYGLPATVLDDYRRRL